MTKTPALVAGAAMLTLASAAAAQDLPRWSLDQACAAQADGRAFCVSSENQAFGYLSGVWITLQPEIRARCLEQIAGFGQNSYRLLGECIEDELTELRVRHVREARGDDAPDPPSAPPAAAEAQPEPEADAPADAGAAPQPTSDTPAPQ